MTFNVISDGDPILATPVMQNWRHVNFGSDLLPVSSTGVSVNNTLNNGSNTFRWAGLYSVLGDFSGNVNFGSTIAVTGVATFSANAQLNSTLNVVGNATFDTSTLFVSASNHNVGIGTALPNSGRILDISKSITGNMNVRIQNTRNVATSDHSILEIVVGGTSGGNPFIDFVLPSGKSYSFGIDNADNDILKIAPNDGDVVTNAFIFFDGNNSNMGIGTKPNATRVLDIVKSQTGFWDVRIFNSSNAASTNHAILEIFTGGTSGGNPMIEFGVNGSTTVTMGIDQADSRNFKISHGDAALATNTRFTMDTSGNITLAQNLTVSGTLGVTGAATLSSTLAVTGNFSVNTNKFNVTASSGNTSVAGTLGVTGTTTLGTLIATGGSTLNQNGNGGGLAVNLNTDPNVAALFLAGGNSSTLSAGITLGYSGTMSLQPSYTGAFTVTKHIYFELAQPSLNSSAAVTDAVIFRFNANAGTHKAVDGATTKTTPGSVDAWGKVDVNGSLRYFPLYASKTA